MTPFGKLLRGFRQQCNDPGASARRLTQERLGQLLGVELDDHGYSGAAVSDWERGKSTIHANDRVVLISLIKVLHEQDGLKTLEDATLLLESGNYRDLNPKEQEHIFGRSESKSSGSKSSHWSSLSRFVLAIGIFNSPKEFQEWLDEAEAGPRPSWPRIVTAFLRRLSDRLAAIKVLQALMWLWIWITGYVLIAPSLRWPFQGEASAEVFIGLFICGSLILPLLTGVLIRTDKIPFWQEKAKNSRVNLRLYVHQGAFIGFHIGYFAIFAINLLLFFLHVRFIPWLQFALLGIPLAMSYIGSHVVPYNLWRAYGRLHLADGAIFFVFVFLGPVWGWFFLEFYRILLTPWTGTVGVLLALTLCAGAVVCRSRHAQNRATGASDSSAEQ